VRRAQMAVQDKVNEAVVIAKSKFYWMLKIDCELMNMYRKHEASKRQRTASDDGNHSLVSLPYDIISEITQFLPTEDACNFLLTCKKIYDGGKYSFDKDCFRIIPVALSFQSIDKINEILEKKHSCFIEKFLIRLDKVDYKSWPTDDTNLYCRLRNTLSKGLKKSSYCDTIVIYDSPEIFRDHNGSRMEIAARAIQSILISGKYRHLKLQFQNIWPRSFQDLWDYDKVFKQVQSMNLRFDYHYDIGRAREILHDIRYHISLAEDLEELSLITISDECLSYQGVDLITSKITSKKLTSLTIEGLDVSPWAREVKSDRVPVFENAFRDILHPFKASLKKLILKRIILDEALFELFAYIQDNFSLDYLSLSDIMVDHKENLYPVLDDVDLDKKDIKKGIDIIRRQLPILV
jgi:hypothetical protein